MSRRPPRRDVFRTTRTLRVLTVIVTLMFAAGLVFAFVSGRTVMIYAFLGLTVMGVLGIVETLVSRVELHDDHILTVALFVRRTHPRSHLGLLGEGLAGIDSAQRNDVGEFAEHRPRQHEDHRCHSRLDERKSMKVFLRIVAGLVGVSVGWAVWLLVVIVRAGLLQFEAALTISVLLLLIAGGSIAAVQLWRLRRTGLTVAMTLCGGVVLSFVLMLVSGSPLTALPGLIVSGGLLAVLLSPAAWRACEER
jgi:hypothetical protein